MNVKNTIEATVTYQNRRYFAQTQSGQLWAITDEDVQRFAIHSELTIVIAEPEMMDQFCHVEYVFPST
jgi:hypothetical protein